VDQSTATAIAVSIRRARMSDAAAITELVNRAYTVEHFFLESHRTSADEIAGLIRSFLVLEYEGGICAAVLFQGPGQRHDLPPSHAYFGMLSVLPELQGMGLGRRLVQVAEAMAEASGASSMSLLVVNLREELRRWYRSLGYREVGTTPFDHPELKQPAHFIEMTKLLAPASARFPDSAVGAA
jgi:ribosomal protein S18 acetylase RimI-like enzyme